MATEEKLEVAFRFDGLQGSTVFGTDFELMQNKPNPLKESTMIAFQPARRR